MSFRLYTVRTLSAVMATVVFSGAFVPKAFSVAVEPNDLMQCEYRESASTEQEALKNARFTWCRQLLDGCCVLNMVFKPENY